MALSYRTVFWLWFGDSAPAFTCVLTRIALLLFVFMMFFLSRRFT